MAWESTRTYAGAISPPLGRNHRRCRSRPLVVASALVDEYRVDCARDAPVEGAPHPERDPSRIRADAASAQPPAVGRGGGAYRRDAEGRLLQPRLRRRDVVLAADRALLPRRALPVLDGRGESPLVGPAPE